MRFAGRLVCGLCLLSVVLLTGAPALADLSRGSRGEDVRLLQQQLIDLGFLEDKADGVFGRKTQAAVAYIQHYLGAEETGVADDGVLNDLQLLWEMAMGIERENGAPVDEDSYPPSCGRTGVDDGGAAYCCRHIAQYPIAIQLTYSNPPEQLENLLTSRICTIWYWAICAMYEEWEERLDYADCNEATLQYDNFLLTLDDKIAQWSEVYGSHLALGTRREEMKWLEAAGVDLCIDLYGAESNGI